MCTPGLLLVTGLTYGATSHHLYLLGSIQTGKLIDPVSSPHHQFYMGNIVSHCYEAIVDGDGDTEFLGCGQSVTDAVAEELLVILETIDVSFFIMHIEKKANCFE